MQIVTRYLVVELLKVFIATLVSMTTFVFIVLIGKAAVDNGLGLAPILRILPYLLPQAMQYAIPGSMLLAATSVYGRVAASNEMVAAKALGISPLKLVWPAFLMAAVMSFGAVKVIDLAVSWGRSGVQRVAIESFEEIVYGSLRTKRHFSRSNFKINVQAVDGKRLIKTIILYYPSRDQPVVTIIADEAQFNVDIEKGVATIESWNLEADGLFNGRSSYPGRKKHPIPLGDLIGFDHNEKSPSDHSLNEIGPAKQKQLQIIEKLNETFAVQTSYALLTGEFEELSTQRIAANQSQVHNEERTLQRYYTEPYRRWANGFSCLCFAIVGVPMAIRRRQGEFWGSFFACFMPILLIYYPMLAGCVSQAKNGDIPPPAVWLGNLVLALWGAWLMRRVIRF